MEATPAHEQLMRQQIELLTGALRERMELLHESGLDRDWDRASSCFQHVELTRDERAAKGLPELPSALELGIASVLEGRDTEARARSMGTETAMRYWLEGRSDRLSNLLDDDAAGGSSLRSPLRHTHAAVAAVSPAFEQPGSPVASNPELREEGANTELDTAVFEMQAKIAAMAHHKGCGEESDGAINGERPVERPTADVDGEELLAASNSHWRDSFTGPPDWQRVDPHPHLALDLGLETISPQADWRDFLASQEKSSEQQLEDARSRSERPLPFADLANYEDESAETQGIRNCEAGAVFDQQMAARSGIGALCMECFDCPCSCSGAEVGGGIRAASLCLVCCDPSGCTC